MGLGFRKNVHVNQRLQKGELSTMSMNRPAKMLVTLVLACVSAFGQAVTSSLVGTVTDPANASIPNVEVQIKDQATVATRTTMSGSEGLFRFNSVPPATYTLTIKSQGFKTYTQQTINLASSETRDLGRIQLTLGSVVEEISVTAVAVAIQTASSEKSALVDGKQLTQLALRGRDLFGYLRLLPGV